MESLNREKMYVFKGKLSENELSTESFSKLIGVSRTTLSKLMNGGLIPETRKTIRANRAINLFLDKGLEGLKELELN